MDGAISAAGAEDGAEFRVIQHLLEVRRAFRICAAEDEVFFSDGVPYPDAKAPALHELYGRFDLFGGNIAGGAGNADRVTVAEVRRDKE